MEAPQKRGRSGFDAYMCIIKCDHGLHYILDSHDLTVVSCVASDFSMDVHVIPLKSIRILAPASTSASVPRPWVVLEAASIGLE